MAPKTIHDRQDLFAVAAHQHPVGLGLHPGRQHRRIHQIGEKYCQPANLTRIGRRGQQILGLGVHPISGQHLLGQRRPGHPITTVDRRHRLIEQIINRRDAPRTGVTVPRRAHLQRRSRQYRGIPRSTVCHNAQPATQRQALHAGAPQSPG